MKEQFDRIVGKLLRSVEDVNAKKSAEKCANRGIRVDGIMHEINGGSRWDWWRIPIGRGFSVGRCHHHRHWRVSVCRNQYVFT